MVIVLAHLFIYIQNKSESEDSLIATIAIDSAQEPFQSNTD